MRHRGEKGRSGERKSCPANAAHTASEEVRELPKQCSWKGFVERRFPFHPLLYWAVNKMGINERENLVKKLLKNRFRNGPEAVFQSSSMR